MVNPELKIGDRVVLLHMDGETSIMPGERGEVTGKANVLGDIQYSVDWDNGSKLSLISGVDIWDTEENFKKRKTLKKKDITETSGEYEKNKSFMKNIDVFKFFKMKFLNDYLKMVRESGITNMFGASPYLYIGREKIEQEMEYKDLEGEQFESMLENADEARDYMIQGTVKWLESNNKEVSVENVKTYLPRFATKVVENYMLLF
jgi:hypothetical protein